MCTKTRFAAALVVAAIAAAVPARGSAASVLDRTRNRLATTLSLGGGLEAGSTSNGLGEWELTVGYEVGDVRPELGLVLGLAPEDHAALRPGLHVAIPRVPAYARAALDFSNVRDGWQVRWVMLGGGLEARLTSELGAFAEADVGLPMASDFGLALVARAGFSLRF
jgi:hypothetical protein